MLKGGQQSQELIRCYTAVLNEYNLTVCNCLPLPPPPLICHTKERQPGMALVPTSAVHVHAAAAHQLRLCDG